MRKLTVIAAGLGWDVLARNKTEKIGDLAFSPRKSVFPAVTCVAQASIRTGLSPAEHGVVSNGKWMEELQKPLFWEQSARLVKGRRVWEKADGGTASVGLFFLQQSLGENVAAIVSPAPIHKHGGGMIMSCYTRPTETVKVLDKVAGKFPLYRYWGPLASPKVGRKCLDWFEAMTSVQDVEEAYLYLPTLDYAAQKEGPGSAADRAAFREFSRQIERLCRICMERGCSLQITGDYNITPVTVEAVRPNVILRRAGLFRTRTVGGMAYPDFYQSTAFAVCDHEFCVLEGEKAAEAEKLLLATGEYVRPGAENVPGKTILLAQPGSWCEYKWWTDDREAPDFAAHVDIHNKPGYDPRELFFFCRGAVKGTHGRLCDIACSEGV